MILAVPARPAARLLAGVPGASAAVTAFGEISYASMAIVTLAYPRSAFPGRFRGRFPARFLGAGWPRWAGAGTWSRPWTGGR